MDYILPNLKNKTEVDHAIKSVEDKVVLIRFGSLHNNESMELDMFMYKTRDLLKGMAELYRVEVKDVPLYVEYFEIYHIPTTVFFFNGHHIKVDYGGPDQTKFVGPFSSKQEFADVVEAMYRGAMQGKFLVTLPVNINKRRNHELFYKSI